MQNGHFHNYLLSRIILSPRINRAQLAGQKMKKIFLALIVALTSIHASAANVEGSWPQDARGGALKRPSWVLVVPAKRQADGSLLVWDRGDSWVRQWIVPEKTPKGLRTVAIVGDSEDKRLIAASQIDNMQSSALRQIARKYNAPAIALAVSGGDEQVVAAWVPGFNATWDYTSGGFENRKASLETIDQLFSGHQNMVSANFGLEQTQTEQVSIMAERFNAEVQLMEYRIRAPSAEAENRILSSRRFIVMGRATSDETVLEIRMNDATPIEKALQEAGLQAR